MSPNITVSEALKGELKRVKERQELYSLDEAINYLLSNPIPGNKELDGYERKLSEPVRVKDDTKELLRYTRDRGRFTDFEAVIRDRAGITKRDTGTEEPVDVRKLA